MSDQFSSKMEKAETLNDNSEVNANYFLPNNSINQNRFKEEATQANNTVFRNPNSIESFTAPSPAGSLIEQFEATTTPLSVDDASDSSINIDSSNSNHTSQAQSTNSAKTLPSSFDSNNSNFRFRRHSSQSSINLPLNLQINNTNSNTNNLVSPLTLTGSYSNINTSNTFPNTERVCSSPINSLKMSSRVCQIKIDEGIEPHLSREIKSERETQNTLKLKSSCDELVINSDDLGLETFSFDRERNNNNSPSFLSNSSANGTSSTFKRYRTFSESQNNTINNLISQNNGNMPSPSLSSCQSYSNSSSPTGFLLNHNNNNNQTNSGLLRCFSPSTTLTNQSLNQSQLNQNYFSQSPSPTRKLFVTRRSMSPIPCNLRPSSLNTSNLINSSKRKISDVEQSDLYSGCQSPKRTFIDNQQEFVQPLLICTSTNNNTNNNNSNSNSNSSANKVLNRSITSSPSPSILNTIPSSPSVSNQNDSKNDSDLINDKPSFISRPNLLPSNRTKLKTDEDTNKYTFVPIQLPPPSSSPGPVSQQLQHKRLIVLTNNSTQNQLNNQLSNICNNSPNSYSCDSPISCSPSVSNVSSLISGDKPESGYQSSAQNNSDSESCT